MSMHHNVGRNDPCPCGSGKKYKKCCGKANQVATDLEKAIAVVALNREIQYIGRVGKRRKDFCIRYINRKRDLLKKIEQSQAQDAMSLGKTVSCHKGCYFCCSEPVSASLSEVEAIAYYLQNNQSTLKLFLESYPNWNKKIEKYPSMVKEYDRIIEKAATSATLGELEVNNRELGNIASAYTKLQLYCPFLVNGACSIYEVRPWACASIISLSPSEWCSPNNPNRPTIRRIEPTFEVVAADVDFYDERYKVNYVGFVAKLVYEVLRGGVLFISSAVPGLEGMKLDVASDPEVKALLEKRKESKNT